MSDKLISCVTLPPATISFVPTHEELADEDMETSSIMSGNMKCPFCNSDRADKTDEEDIEELMKRAEANDAASNFFLANHYYFGVKGLQQDHARAIELFTRAADLGDSKAHFHLGVLYREGGNLKKAKFHFEAAAMAGHEGARNTLGCMEEESRNMERAVKHWTIAASAGSSRAMRNLLMALGDREVSRESIDSTLIAYNNSCVEMRSEARDACIQFEMTELNYE